MSEGIAAAIAIEIQAKQAELKSSLDIIEKERAGMAKTKREIKRLERLKAKVGGQ